MPRTITTDAIVIGSRKLGEADRIVIMLTKNLGMVSVVAKGSRKINSRFGGRLESFTQLQVQLFEGRSLYTLTGADTQVTHASSRADPRALKAGLSLVDLIRRSIPEHERRPRTFNLLANHLKESDLAVANGGLKEGFRALALGSQLKLLLLLGYLPHLSHCCSCSSPTGLERFSAAAGGALCASCAGENIPVSAETLDLMRMLLEEPLNSAWRLEVDDRILDGAWRCIRELCLYYQGFDPRLKP